MSTVWGPYHEYYDATYRTYSLFRAPNPSVVIESPTPILKDSVSMLLNEILKPARVFGTQTLNGTEVSPEKPDEARIRAAIALMDQSVIKAVDSAKDSREAISILSLYDPRFGDAASDQAFSDKILSYFRRLDASAKKRPGPQSSGMDSIREYFESHRERVLRALAKDHSLTGRRVLAMEITIRVVDPEAQKPDDRVMRFLRMLGEKLFSKRSSATIN